MKTKKIILIMLIILLNGIVFMFSGQTGEKSESLSDTVVIEIIDKYSLVSKNEVSQNKKNEIVKNTRFLVRKGAHFTIYFLMGVLVYILVLCYDVKRPIILTLIVCFEFACFDEIHQLFSAGRSARIFDVGVDTLGSFGGILLVRLINYRKSFLVRRNKNE